MNPISDETTLMRPHLLTGLLSNAADNVRRFVDDVRLYEAGKAFGKSHVEGHFEEPRLGVILCGKRLPGDWSGADAPADFFDMKGVVEPLLLHLAHPRSTSSPPRLRPFFEEGKAADLLRDGEVIGWFGAIRKELLASFELTGPVFYGEIRLQGDRFAAAAGAIRTAAEVSPCFQGCGVRLPGRGAGGRRSRDGSRGFPPEVEEAAVFDIFTGEKIGDGEQERRDPGETAIP